MGAAKKLGELRSTKNGLSALKEFVDAGTASDATPEQRALAEAAQASIKQIDAWSWWASMIESLFPGISLSSILLIMSAGAGHRLWADGRDQHGARRVDDGGGLCHVHHATGVCELGVAGAVRLVFSRR
ncbi:MAG: hypothetical protein QM706_05045 [Nitrospira sp.]